MSIHQLARHTFSSASTIVRLCNHTGYSGYKEFRKAVTYELAQREQTKRTEQKEIARSDSLEEIIDKITYQNILSLEETKELLDVDVIRECVEMIKNARVIYLFGLGASLYAAKDAYLKFLRLNKLCIINEDWHSQLNIIDILYTALANDRYEETLDQLSRTHIHKPGSPVGKGKT